MSSQLRSQENWPNERQRPFFTYVLVLPFTMIHFQFFAYAKVQSVKMWTKPQFFPCFYCIWLCIDFFRGDAARASELTKEIFEIDEKTKGLDKLRTSSIHVISYINERNRRKNLVNAEKAIKVRHQCTWNKKTYINSLYALIIRNIKRIQGIKCMTSFPFL